MRREVQKGPGHSGAGYADGKRRRLWLFLALLWTGVIWVNSLQPAELSGAASDGVVELVEPVLTAVGIPAEEQSFVVRKCAHLTEFAVLGALWSARISEKGRLRGVLTALALCMAAALLDEGIQFFVPGRSCQLRDVGIDALGAALGIGLCTAVFRMKEKRTPGHR